MQSLHNIFSDKPSPYQHAIRTIGNIIKVYDSDQKFPVWGFGAHFDNIKVGHLTFNGVLHDFNLNFNVNDPEVYDIYGIEQTYLQSIRGGTFALSGPTLFAPILSKAHSIAASAVGTLQYFILLIITDGIINDMKLTRNEFSFYILFFILSITFLCIRIVAMSNENLPISIIIVGVGNANFSAMDELDGDDYGLMNSKGQVAKRDIVKYLFVCLFVLYFVVEKGSICANEQVS